MIARYECDANVFSPFLGRLEAWVRVARPHADYLRLPGPPLLQSDDQLPGEPAPLPRRVRHATLPDEVYHTHLGTTSQAHQLAFAHRFVCLGAAGPSRGHGGHPEQPAGGRRSRSSWSLTTIRRATRTFATRWNRDAAAFRRCMVENRLVYL